MIQLSKTFSSFASGYLLWMVVKITSFTLCIFFWINFVITLFWEFDYYVYVFDCGLRCSSAYRGNLLMQCFWFCLSLLISCSYPVILLICCKYDVVEIYCNIKSIIFILDFGIALWIWLLGHYNMWVTCHQTLFW